jgi:hypothetical protein
VKYAHIENETNKIKGWYDKDIHSEIPTPNIEVSEEVWQEAVNINANCYENGDFIVKDFRTNEEIVAQQEAKELEKQAAQRKADMIEGEVYTLNGVDYQVSFTKDDGDGLVQVKSAFDLGLASTVIHFENGTKLPITVNEFPVFALWFVEKRNNFFEV